MANVRQPQPGHGGAGYVQKIERLKESTPVALCQRCRQLVDDVLNDDIYDNPRWSLVDSAECKEWQTKHHGSSFALHISGYSCSICHFLSHNSSNKLPALYAIVKPKFSRTFRLTERCLNQSVLEYRSAVVFSFSESYDVETLLSLDTPLVQTPAYPRIDEYYMTAPITDLSWLGKRILPLADHPACFALSKRWLSDCNKWHTHCNSEGHAKLPTRVIYVGDTMNPEVFLHVSTGESSPYVALSHCWGGILKEKCVQSNLATYQNGINLSELPATFKDAIRVTRELGFLYIWIDALCILQDDPNDWKREAAMMSTYYGGSALTIAAGDTKCSVDGFLRSREDRIHAAPLGTYTMPDHTVRNLFIQRCDTSHWVGRSLDQRGWTLQERILSPKVLHYTDRGIFWECRELFTHEKGGSHAVHPVMKGLSLTSRNNGEEIGLSQLWRTLVRNYSARKLTVSSDKLPAISGLAAMFQEMHGGEYLAGIWKHDLPISLLWQRCTWQDGLLQPVQPLRAPSWSWASVDGEFQWTDRTYYSKGTTGAEARFSVKEACVFPEALISFSYFTKGHLLLEGVLDLAYYHHQCPVQEREEEHETGVVSLPYYRRSSVGEHGYLQSKILGHIGSRYSECYMDSDCSERECWIMFCRAVSNPHGGSELEPRIEEEDIASENDSTNSLWILVRKK